MAELGFLGVKVVTRTQTPRFWGQFWSAGDLFFFPSFFRPLFTNWFTVGIFSVSVSLYY
jgi:hypothetical protein